MTFDAVRAAYGSRVAEYVEAVGEVEHVPDDDRRRILEWATGVTGPVLDVGSGPGQWTDLLRRAGVDIEGVEPVPEFVAQARRLYPDSRYHEGRAERLDAPDASLGGILAWYSLIHTDPEAIDPPLAEFARALAPGGSLLVGFFTGARLEPFEHAVVTAYYWPAKQLAGRIESAGFTIDAVHVRFDPGVAPGPGSRPQAIVVATRTA
ncbi:class I SAM-dependent methyltransferase [Agromyces sp. G08B096]|uniref:Class I SAM-dependent methyltransferase n=1 Tax=Agromyces sp. G08B096 TaxID=3156399 RepID=A0AAU7W9A0_9MICO